MLRRLHPDQPESFAFTPDNQTWAEAQIKKFPEGRQASAIIPLLWRAQEQEGWLSRPAIEHVAEMLDLAYIRALEVASFYFMFQLQPVGSVAHVQICGTLSCMICGAEDLIGVCKEKIADAPHSLSADGKFSWEEVECLGACANAPMAQIGKDYYEDLTETRLREIIDELAAGRVPTPGPQNGRYAAEPLQGLTSLKDHEAGKEPHNASVAAAVAIGDTVKRIDGTEVPHSAPWVTHGVAAGGAAAGGLAMPAKVKATDGKGASAKPAKAKQKPPSAKGKGEPEKPEAKTAKTEAAQSSGPDVAEVQPETLSAPRSTGADDLKKISGVGPKLEGVLNDLGFWHFDQIAAWTEQEVAWVDSRLKFKGRITRDNWIAQAAELAKSQ